MTRKERDDMRELLFWVYVRLEGLVDEDDDECLDAVRRALARLNVDAEASRRSGRTIPIKKAQP